MTKQLETTHPFPLARSRPILLLLAFTLLLAALAPSVASARTTRAYQSSFGSPLGSGTDITPGWLAVDQSNGDVYAYGPEGKVSRFDSAGAPRNFTSGPDAGTNTLTGFGNSGTTIAIDNSGGLLNGTIYITDNNTKTVKAFAASGAGLGAITGTGVDQGRFRSLCGLAVDQSNGSLYVSQFDSFNPGGGVGSFPGKTWRYAPSSPSGALDDADYALTGATADQVCVGAANAGAVYSVGPNGDLLRYAASDFTANSNLQPVPTTIDSGATAVAVDPRTGEIYSNHGGEVQVFDSAAVPQYEFGARAYFGAESAGIAVDSAASGPAEKAYVADPSSEHEVDVFGGLTKVPRYTHPDIAIFGPDGTSATQFNFNAPTKLAFDEASQSLYALDSGRPGIYGFDASAPPAFGLLGGFNPLGTVAFGAANNDGAAQPGFAVDNTALASAGNVYLASDSTDLIYGWDSTGAPLGGAFPIDPATTPGAPDGSPKDLCGAAVDSAGNVWVSNSSTQKVLKYSPAGAYLGAIDTSAQRGGPCTIALDSNDNLYADIARSGVWKYTAASGYTTATHVVGGLGNNSAQTHSLAVDPGNDHLYVANDGGWVDEFDPAGNLIDEFATGISFSRFKGIAFDPANGNLYVADAGNSYRKIRAFGPGLLLPDIATKAATALANTTATLNGEVITQGVVLSDCHFEYVKESAFNVTGFGDLSTGGSAPCTPSAGSIPLDLDEHPVSAAATGLIRNTSYRFRLIATNADGTTTSADAGFISAGPPIVETTGSPIRTATTALLQARVYPVRAATTYHFEYGADGPCDSNPCASTPNRSAGSGDEVRLAAEWIRGLSADTTYHYRVVADNGNSEGPQAGADMTVSTYASDKPLSHGNFPGPPGSDRAWELVSMPDSGGNPLGISGFAFSGIGDRAMYSISGGTPLSEFGSLFSLYFSERPAGAHPTSGWGTRLLTPAREDSNGATWSHLVATDDLSSMLAFNYPDPNNQAVAGVWRLSPADTPLKVFQQVPPMEFALGGYFGHAISPDGSRVLGMIQGGTPDPVHPTSGTKQNLYDIGSGPPQLLSLLPGETVPACGVEGGAGAFEQTPVLYNESHWIADDASSVLFPSKGSNCSDASQIYLRDIDAGQTTPISPPPLSGLACDAGLLKWTPGAIFFTSSARLAANDTAPASCAVGSDAYRYDLGDRALRCLTCLVAGLEANLPLGTQRAASVSDDGSRLYFRSAAHLLAGTPPAGTQVIYRLKVASGELAYVAPSYENLFLDGAMTPDGSVFFFASDSQAIEPLGGAMTNGGTSQIYRYDDADRSLSCAGCPRDGAVPLEDSSKPLSPQNLTPGQANTMPLSEDGTLAFTTTTALVSADQNTPSSGRAAIGTDVYEWRADGRLLLVTDGLSRWPAASPPLVFGIGNSGRDLFFRAPAQYTPDAIDTYLRLYDARIGGGIDFPRAPEPCPLEVCQGTPRGAPEAPSPGSSTASGPADPTPSFEGPRSRRPCRRGKVRRKGRCVPRHRKGKSASKNRAGHGGRAQR